MYVSDDFQYISNDSHYTLISGTSYDDRLYNEGSHVTMVGGNGDDTMVSYSTLVAKDYEGDVFFYGGAGKDEIKVFGGTLLADGGSGDDYIYTSGDNNTVVGGIGNDSIDLRGVARNVLIKYDLGDGNDTITGFNSNATIKVTGGNYNTYNSGDDLIVNVGSGSITLKDMAGKSINIDGEGTLNSGVTSSNTKIGRDITDSSNHTLISGTDYDDSIYTYGSYVTINGGKGNDYIDSFDDYSGDYAGNVTINGDDGKDTINGWGYPGFIDGGNDADYLYAGNDSLTVNGGSGDDEIITYGYYTSINAGSGNDSIKLTSIADDSTVMAGTGNDTVTLSELTRNVLIQYSSGDGSDIIEGFNSYDTIKITDSTYSKLDTDNDLLLKVGNGSILLKNMAGKAINIIGTVEGGSSVQETVQPVTYAVDDNSEKQTDSSENNANVYYITNIINVYNNTTVNVSETTINVSETIINVTENNTYIYNGGTRIIQNYQQGEVVRLESDYQGIDLRGNSFFVNSSSGQLEIQNSRDKFIGYSAVSNNVVAYSYVASGGGDVDGRGKSQAEIMIGGDHSNNQMYAGSGGSSLWGGNGGADTLVGGEGYDEFFFAMGSGGDVIQNASSNDMINLLGVSLNQISGVYVSTEQVHINFINGEFLQVKGNTGVGYRLENQTYVCNQSTGQWTTK